MNDRWQLRVYDKEHAYVFDLNGRAEIGREAKEKNDDAPPSHKLKNGCWRVVIEPASERSISREHLTVTPLPGGAFELRNVSAKQVVGLPQDRELGPGASCEVTLPIVLRLGRKTLRLQHLDEESTIVSLPLMTMMPGNTASGNTASGNAASGNAAQDIGANPAGLEATLARIAGPAMEGDQMRAWVTAFLGLLQSAAGSEDFYVKAARALVDLVKLDSGRVLFRVGDDWREHVFQSAPRLQPAPPWQPSRSVLANVLREKRTTWQVPDTASGASTRDIDAVVSAPILDRQGNVIGALYGERRLGGVLPHRPITELEAMLVEVLASGVAAGLARVEQEQAALRVRLQMEQYLGPRLAAKLADRPDLLQGRDAMVSILVCDIRGFSRISERLGPARTVEWIADVMGVLSQCVLDHEGVVVDYVGDDVMAMWGAPEDQPDHASRACRAALAMLEKLPGMNERWQPILQEPMQLAIGINSGIAQVGNIGSRLKFKYGALGHTVNMASRVQGATRHLKSQLLITDTTQTHLDGSFATRRLCIARVVNIEQPVTLHELVPARMTRWTALKQSYEEALDHYSKGDFRPACRILGQLMQDYPEDGPAILLLSRAVACLAERPDRFDPVMVLAGK